MKSIKKSRTEYTCQRCHKVIEKGTSYLNNSHHGYYYRYHIECDPKGKRIPYMGQKTKDIRQTIIKEPVFSDEIDNKNYISSAYRSLKFQGYNVHKYESKGRIINRNIGGSPFQTIYYLNGHRRRAYERILQRLGISSYRDARKAILGKETE